MKRRGMTYEDLLEEQRRQFLDEEDIEIGELVLEEMVDELIYMEPWDE